jgi:hypothetical protein
MGGDVESLGDFHIITRCSVRSALRGLSGAAWGDLKIIGTANYGESQSEGAVTS